MNALFSTMNAPVFPSFGHSVLAPLLHPNAPTWSARHQIARCALPAFWQDWLLDSGSLTQRLKALRPGQFSVQVLQEYYAAPTVIERREMHLYTEPCVWVRDVILCIEHVPAVYARTAMPLTTPTGEEKRLQSLGNRSLGSYLFRQPSLQRGPLLISRCPENDLGLIWSRRSVFSLRNKPLMVSEGFTQSLIDFVK